MFEFQLAARAFKFAKLCIRDLCKFEMKLCSLATAQGEGVKLLWNNYANDLCVYLHVYYSVCDQSMACWVEFKNWIEKTAYPETEKERNMWVNWKVNQDTMKIITQWKGEGSLWKSEMSIYFYLAGTYLSKIIINIIHLELFV